jgi:hypothetical protein
MENTMESEAGAPPQGASIWERELYEHLTGHVQREGALLEKYVNAASATGSQAFAYVVRMLAADERRHHGQMGDLARSLKAEVELNEADLVVPRLDFDKVDRKAVLAITRELLENEKQDAAALRKLRQDLKSTEGATLWGLIVETMQIDTQKHIALLRYVQRQVRSRTK